MYIFAMIILACSLACTFMDAVTSPKIDLFNAVLSAGAVFAFIYIVNL